MDSALKQQAGHTGAAGPDQFACRGESYRNSAAAVKKQSLEQPDRLLGNLILQMFLFQRKYIGRIGGVSVSSRTVKELKTKGTLALVLDGDENSVKET